MCVCVCVCVCVNVCVCVSVNVHACVHMHVHCATDRNKEKQRERKKHRDRGTAVSPPVYRNRFCCWLSGVYFRNSCTQIHGVRCGTCHCSHCSDTCHRLRTDRKTSTDHKLRTLYSSTAAFRLAAHFGTSPFFTYLSCPRATLPKNLVSDCTIRAELGTKTNG